MARMMRLGPLAVIVLLGVGCVGIEATFDIRADGSGTLTLDYRVSLLATELADPAEPDRLVPLPLSRADFDLALVSAPSLRLVRFSQREDAEAVHVSAQIAFQRVADLNELQAFAETPISLSTSNGATELRYVLVAAADNDQPISDDVMVLARSLFSGYEIAYQINAPAEVTAASGGDISANRRSVRMQMSVVEYLQAAPETALMVRW